MTLAYWICLERLCDSNASTLITRRKIAHRCADRRAGPLGSQLMKAMWLVLKHSRCLLNPLWHSHLSPPGVYGVPTRHKPDIIGFYLAYTQWDTCMRCSRLPLAHVNPPSHSVIKIGVMEITLRGAMLLLNCLGRRHTNNEIGVKTSEVRNSPVVVQVSLAMVHLFVGFHTATRHTVLS